MKHSLLALALAGTLSVLSAGSAAAADVEVYGLIDLGLSYVHANPDVKDLSSKSKFSMENATEFGSRFGIKGTEDLGSGFKAGFDLENGFNADDGSLDQGGDLFGREAHLDLYTPYGAFSFGVMPTAFSAPLSRSLPITPKASARASRPLRAGRASTMP